MNTKEVINYNNEESWQKHFADSFSDLKSLADYLNIKINDELKIVKKKYPVQVTKYYANLIDKNKIFQDPIFKQCFPSSQELESSLNLNLDGLNENDLMPVPRLIRKYSDRAVILSSNECAMHCRFCFRKRQWKHDRQRSNISMHEINVITDYLKENKEISEVLLSGGDPLIMNDSKIFKIIDEISDCKNISVIRVCTRMLVTLPQRITDSFAKELSKRNKVWVVSHFNHEKELTNESVGACSKLIKNGINVLNQSVLLKGINDSEEKLEKLLKKLVANKIIPLYLFHIDPIKSVEHFATGIDCGLELIEKLRPKVSSLAMPTFAIDLPEGGGKVNLQPNFLENGKYIGINNKKIKYPFYNKINKK